jgi:hypothetical protein
MIGMNPITVKNDTIVTLHLDDEECCSERLAPYGELHGDDTLSLHRVAPPMPLSVWLVFTLIILPLKLLEDGVRHQVDDSAAIDGHPRDRSASYRCDPKCTTASGVGLTLQASRTWPL